MTDPDRKRSSFYVSDKLHSDPTMNGLSLTALGVWVRAGSWSALHGTKGWIPAALIEQWDDVERDVSAAAQELEGAGVWLPGAEGDGRAGWIMADDGLHWFGVDA